MLFQAQASASKHQQNCYILQQRRLVVILNAPVFFLLVGKEQPSFWDQVRSGNHDQASRVFQECGGDTTPLIDLRVFRQGQVMLAVFILTIVVCMLFILFWRNNRSSFLLGLPSPVNGKTNF